MSVESIVDSASQGFLMGLAVNLNQRIQSSVFYLEFDMQKQVSLAIEEEREKVREQVSLALEEERNKMDWYQMSYDGLHSYHPSRSNLASTPPMPPPFNDHDPEADDSGLPAWPSGSSSSSPFRQTFPHGLPSIGDTVSPQELQATTDPHGLVSSGNYQEDMTSMLIWSDSDNSLPALPQPPVPSSPHRRASQRSGTSSRPSTALTYQEGRRPLPTGPGQPIAPREFGPPLVGTEPDPQGPSSAGGPHDQSPPDLILPSNGSTRPGSRASHRRTPSSVAAPQTWAPPLPAAMDHHHGLPIRVPGAFFPPGQDTPSFVPVGRTGIASAAQGNTWPIERELFEQLVAAERGHGAHRRGNTKLTYKEILAKYNKWDVRESTLRGIKRKITLPKEHRERVPRWSAEHIDSLCINVPLYTDSKGKVAWANVVAAIKRDTGRPFGTSTTSKKWADLNNNNLNNLNNNSSNSKTEKKKTARPAQEQQSQSGGDEGDGEEGESSTDVSGLVDISEEDLPSHRFSFQQDDDDLMPGHAGTKG